jgi:hypothetical protein
MNLIAKIAIAFTIIFALSTVICGVSIAQAGTFEQSSLDFHMGLGIVTILISFATIGMLARSAKK